MNLHNRSIVILERLSDYRKEAIKAIFIKSIGILGLSERLKKAKNITIKINLCDARPPETGAITHPTFLGALLEYIREYQCSNASINVIESDATVAAPDLFIKWFGFDILFKKWNVRYINVSKIPFTWECTNGKVLKYVPVPKIIAESDIFISMAKLKTNILTDVTCCLKNLFGCLPLVKKSIFHPAIDYVIAETAKAMMPDLCIIDGIIGMGGAKGPAYGTPIKAGVVIIGLDPVATDSVAARVMGFNPRRIKHLVIAQKLGLGSIENVTVLNMEGKERDIPLIQGFKSSLIERAALRLAINIQSHSRLSCRKNQ